MDKKKLIGAALMLPLPVLLISLILKTDFWVYLILVALASFAFSYGLKLVKGASAEDIKKEILKDVDDIKEEVEDKVEKLK
jgi:hypothetical protein